jgi:hypothetical protein
MKFRTKKWQIRMKQELWPSWDLDGVNKLEAGSLRELATSYMPDYFLMQSKANPVSGLH